MGKSGKRSKAPREPAGLGSEGFAALRTRDGYVVSAAMVFASYRIMVFARSLTL